MTAPTLPAAKPRHDYPRPPLVRDHRDLFREADYGDGQPYSDGLDDEDDQPPTITA
ncbi:hypothetical protein OIE75_41185 (plasmid) [Streptomyces sp. NBC_01723]|uniref:hypothetical protein n=1 Tax=Streptomyces sp. NBC_01723 TaxID=2975921 RepID=UPI002E32C087|nr:hypothetical protein [Streptomyces sp. NBC_01723]